MRAFEATARLMGRALICAALAACFGLLLGASEPLVAKSRDADASRMQARRVDFPSNHTDRLDPPDDHVDWRYFKLAEATTISLVLSSDTAGAQMRIGVFSAAGRELVAGKANDGQTRLTTPLDPGVYYVSVEAETPTGYELSVR